MVNHLLNMICGTPIKTEKSLKSYSTPSRSPKNRSGYEWSLPQKERKEYVLVDRNNSKKGLLKRLNPVNWFNSKLKAKDGGYSKSPSVRKAFVSSMFPDRSITNVSQLRKVIETPYNQNDDSNIVGASPYRILDQIADGGFSTVYRAEHRLTSTIVAIKKISKSKHYRHPKQKIYLENEKQNMKLLDHRNIIKLLQIVESEDTILFIMEHVEGNDIFNEIKFNGIFSITDTKNIFSQITYGIKYLHCDISIVHLDLKPENVIISHSGAVKIVDFGLACVVKDDELFHRTCGTIEYFSYEILLGKYYFPKAADMWALALILFSMVTGKLLFVGKTKELMIESIEKNWSNHKHPHPLTRHHQINCVIKGCLDINPARRWNITDLIKHPFIIPEPIFHSKPTELDVKRLKYMKQMGFPIEYTKDSVTKQTYDSAHSMYNILGLEKV